MKLLSNGHVLMTPAVVPVLWPTFWRLIWPAIPCGKSAMTIKRPSKAGGFDLVSFGFHHDFVPLDNGHVLVLVSDQRPYTDLPGYPGTTTVVGDAIIDLDASWNPVWTWSTFDHLDVNRHPLAGLPDWTHGNGLAFDSTDGNILFSMRNQSWVVKIDYNRGAGTGALVWKLGYEGDFAISGGDPSQWSMGSTTRICFRARARSSALPSSTTATIAYSTPPERCACSSSRPRASAAYPSSRWMRPRKLPKSLPCTCPALSLSGEELQPAGQWQHRVCHVAA